MSVTESLSKASDKKYDIRFAMGFGMVAGIAYATLTGATLTVPALPGEAEASSEASEVA